MLPSLYLSQILHGSNPAWEASWGGVPLEGGTLVWVLSGVGRGTVDGRLQSMHFPDALCPLRGRIPGRGANLGEEVMFCSPE